MKTFRQWLKANYNEDLPADVISGEWFSKRGLPMIVSCTCCDMTMALPSALIDSDNQVFCSSCGG